MAYKGRLRRGISDGDLREILMEHFVKPEEDEGNSKIKKWLKGRRTHEQKIKIKKANVKGLRSLLYNNKFVLLLSVILAFGIWIWVSIEKKPRG